LNKEYGPGNKHYEALCNQIKQGLDDGWVAQTGQCRSSGFATSKIPESDMSQKSMDLNIEEVKYPCLRQKLII